MVEVFAICMMVLLFMTGIGCGLWYLLKDDSKDEKKNRKD